MDLHGKKIYVNNSNYKKVLNSTFKSRDVLLNQDDINIINSEIKKKSKMLFMPNDLKESAPFLEYKLYLAGILPCGSKTTLTITNIKPFVDIDYNDSMTKEENVNNVKSLLETECLKKKLRRNVDVDKLELIEGKKLILFKEEKSKFIRIYFNKKQDRNEFIHLLVKLEINTYNDDLSSYYRVIARQFKINLSSWNIIKNYTHDINTNFKAKYNLVVDIKNIKAFKNDDISLFSFINPNLITKDKSISMAFDIEQYCCDFDINNPLKITRMPSGKILEDTIFNIGMVYSFINEPLSKLNIGLMIDDCEEHDDYLTVICNDEKILLLVFGYINSIIQPDFITEFNGSDFDYDSIIDKAKIFNILKDIVTYMSLEYIPPKFLTNESIEKFYIKSEYIKMSAEQSKHMKNINLFGYTPFDVRIIFMCLNPTESKSSLNFYLKINNLQLKDDMPISDLFTYYKKKDYVGLGLVNHYCYVDCLSLHKLIYKANVIQDRREVGILSFTSIFDCFYRANGLKVRNLIVAESLETNLFFSNIKKEIKEEDKCEGKYPGALVLNPKRGLVSPLLSLEEFAKSINIFDEELLNETQKLINNNYEAVFIQKNINYVNKDE